MRARLAWVLGAVLVAAAVWSLAEGQDGAQPARPAQPAEPSWEDASLRVLLVGNSFTSANRLDRLVDGLLKAADREAYVRAVAPGGFRFDQHAEEAEKPGSLLDRELRRPKPGWDYVVLQNQSQVPAYPPELKFPALSLEAVVALGQRAHEGGAETVLFQTWGYMRGAPGEASRFPDYPTMQDKLTAGYARYETRLNVHSVPCQVAPVGEAFRGVFTAERGDPAEAGKRFHSLYSQDAKHPGLAGSYLAAAVIVRTLLERAIERKAAWAPRGLDEAEAEALRRFADQACR